MAPRLFIISSTCLSWCHRLSPAEIGALSGKVLVETATLAEIGKAHGFLKDDGTGTNFVNLEERGFYRICAPAPGQTNRATGIIFWEMVDDEDRTPSSDKIVSYHSSHLLLAPHSHPSLLKDRRSCLFPRSHKQSVLSRRGI